MRIVEQELPADEALRSPGKISYFMHGGKEEVKSKEWKSRLKHLRDNYFYS